MELRETNKLEQTPKIVPSKEKLISFSAPTQKPPMMIDRAKRVAKETLDLDYRVVMEEVMMMRSTFFL